MREDYKLNLFYVNKKEKTKRMQVKLKELMEPHLNALIEYFQSTEIVRYGITKNFYEEKIKVLEQPVIRLSIDITFELPDEPIEVYVLLRLETLALKTWENLRIKFPELYRVVSSYKSKASDIKLIRTVVNKNVKEIYVKNEGRR